MSATAARHPAWLATAWNIAWRAVIALGLIAFIALHLNLARVGMVLRHMVPGFAVAAALVMLLVGMITAAKWLVLLRALGIRAAPAEVLRLTYIAVAWNLALPGGESGNLVKAALLARQQRDAAGAVWASSLVDQLSLAVAQILVGIATLLLARFPPPHLGLWLGTSALLLAGILLVYALFLLPWRAAKVDAAIAALSRRLAIRRKNPPASVEDGTRNDTALARQGAAYLSRSRAIPRISRVIPRSGSSALSNNGVESRREWLAPLWQGLTRYRGHVGALAGAVALAALYYATIFLAYWLAAQGLGIAFGYADIAWILALAGIAALLPITVAGVGVRDGIIVYYLHERGVVLETALAFSFTVLALQIVLGLPGIVAHFIHPLPGQTQSA
jgi:uncharacterized membrane protein YbhN (UPF0104 family)